VSSAVTVSSAARRPLRAGANVLRGFLIGMAELVPGVSGGTVALVTGVYDALVDSASHVLGAVRHLVTGPERRRGASTELARTSWLLVGPVLLGMAAAVLTMAGLMSAFVADHPEHARGLFLGLVAASVVVPLTMLPPRCDRPARDRPARARSGRRSGGGRLRELALVVAAAVLAFWLTGLSGAESFTRPSYLLVLLAAAVAVCALVVPGVSGSFFLLAVGLYQPTLTAVHERDLGYLAVFATGAALGLATFVQLLHYLLRHRRRATLLAMAGLMVGSLRALWPWQGDGTRVDGETHGAGALLAPHDPWLGPTLLVVVGASVVLLLIAVERHLEARREGQRRAVARG
jgi:putative membrane protein